jgi:hypothetical protein
MDSMAGVGQDTSLTFRGKGAALIRHP